MKVPSRKSLVSDTFQVQTSLPVHLMTVHGVLYHIVVDTATARDGDSSRFDSGFALT